MNNSKHLPGVCSATIWRAARAVGWFSVMALVAQPQPATAVDYTWTGTNAATWNTTDTNWTPSATTPWNSVNGAGNAAIFTNTSGSLSISGTNFANRVNSTGTSGTFQIAGNTDALQLTGTTPTIDVASGGILNVTARLLGDFTKTGNGELTLNPLSPVARAGNNTLSNGVLNVNSHQALGTNTTTVGAGTTLNFTFTAGQLEGAALAGSGTINSSVPGSTGGGAYNFATMSSFTGTWNIGQTGTPGGGAGRVQLAGGALNSAATFNVRSNITLWDSTGTTRGANLILNGGDIAESIGQLRLSSGGNWTGAVTIAGAMTGANDAHIGVFGADATVSGSISGSPTLSLFSTANQWIALSGSNTHTGDTILSQSSATLRIANANALQSSSLAGSLGAVQFSGITAATLGGLKDNRNIVLTNVAGSGVTLSVGNNGQNTTYGGALSGAGVLRKVGAGTLTLTGANTHGNTEINGGTLQINTGGSLITANTTWVGTAGTGALNINGGSYSNVNVNVGHLGGTGTVNLTSGSFSAQNLTVGGGDSVAGTLNLNGGTFAVSGSFNVGTNGTINVNTGGVLSGGSGGNLYATNTNSVVKFNGGTGSTSLNLYVGNGGAVDLNGQSIATNTWANLVTDNPGGVLRNSSTNAATIASNNTIWVRGVTNLNLTIDAGGGDIQINSTITSSGAPNGGIIKTGTNALVLNNAGNDYTGNTTINAGTLALGGSGALSSSTAVAISNAATFNVGGRNQTIAGLSGAGTVTNTGAFALTVNKASGADTFSGTIAGGGGLTKAGGGTLTLSGTTANTYTGATTVTNGTLNLSKTAGVNAISGSSVGVGPGATLLISVSDQVTNSATVTLSGGTIARAGGVSETMGNLNLTADSILDYVGGAAGNLQFGTYSPTLKLTLNNFGVGNTLKFGSDLTTFIPIGYTAGGSFTNSYFSINGMDAGAFGGFTAAFSSGTFTITSVPESSTVLAALGLAGLMLWPAARRLRRNRAD
jgi:fibronectin-binding autotransporter adhesin